ncbi:glycosyltransferase family 4 protein [Psychrobacillus soli]|uniref:Glycosyltransferase family 4 protein n=1 Tax=Psychrobacillus soli TaxID=1543965 RepID=A0A544T5J7_9BACI|nr:glycosyltransferase family 4 protein [Psychrobacillus soli]TQR12717.1 glycosyltransferase family 4 protein [Psychrobacillus soli]
MKRLHFFFYSQLIEGFGGVETWADYFFPILSENKNIEINIYYVHDDNNVNKKLVTKWSNDKIRAKLKPIKINSPEKRFFLLNYIAYSEQVEKYISNKDISNDYFIFIGSIMGSFCNSYLSWKNINYKSSKKIVWIRSKSVGEVGNALFGIKKRIAGFLEKSLLKKSTKIITNGYDTKQFYEMMYPEIANKILCIPNAIPHNFNYLAINTDRLKKQYTIVYAGRLHESKGFSYFERVSQQSSINKKFIAYGDDTHLQKRLPTINYQGKYKFTDLESIFQTGDIFLFLNISSMAGGLSHSLLEAMSAGKIIVAWNNDVHKQVLNDSNSWLVEEGNSKKLIEVIEKICVYSHEGNGIIDDKRRQARNNSLEFNPNFHVDKFIEIL